MKRYSLRKGYRLLRTNAKRAQKAGGPTWDAWKALRDAIKAKDKPAVTERANRLHDLLEVHAKRGVGHFVKELVVAIVLALIVATVVRQMVFEPMEIPSGSMRPTFQELDRLLVSKTTFGINIPMKPAHLLFEPELVNRHGVFIFTSEDMDIPGQDITYFGIPSKMRLIKRNMGLPGDTLYYYGGQIHGIDKDGNPIAHAEGLTHVPYLSFDGQMKGNILTQTGVPIARITQLPDGKLVPELLVDGVSNYSDLWGFGNYAMARIVKQKDGLALELHHTPSLKNLTLGRDITGHFRPLLSTQVWTLPLSQEHLETLFDNLYTSRFIVRNERAYPDRQGNGPLKRSPYRPHFPGVPDGRYEFENGVAYSVGFGGIQSKLAADHPLNQKTAENIARLFNYGIEMITLVEQPARFAYWRDGELFVMNGPLLSSDDPALKEASGTPLKDAEAPTPETITTYGLKVPPKSYLALGDNYAGSRDSRAFGFVPEENLRGSPSLIIWPPGPRWGTPQQPPYPWLSTSRLIVYGVLILIAILYWLYRRRQRTHLLSLN